ncbi:hypothetical protein ES705_29443 [subsurface metagenome]
MRFRKGKIYFFLFLITSMFLVSLTNVLADQPPPFQPSPPFWFNVGPNQFESQSFTSTRNFSLIQLNIKVEFGGPVSVFILDQASYMLWIPENEEEDWTEVSAKVGGQNITGKSTIEGQLGPPGDYELIVDNRQNSDNAGVNIDIVVTLPGYSALLSFLALIPLVIFLKKKKIKRSIR